MELLHSSHRPFVDFFIFFAITTVKLYVLVLAFQLILSRRTSLRLLLIARTTYCNGACNTLKLVVSFLCLVALLSAHIASFIGLLFLHTSWGRSISYFYSLLTIGSGLFLLLISRSHAPREPPESLSRLRRFYQEISLISSTTGRFRREPRNLQQGNRRCMLCSCIKFIEKRFFLWLPFL